MQHEWKKECLHSRISIILLVAAWACVPEGSEPNDELRDLSGELPTQLAGSALADGRDSSLSESAAASNSLEADFNGDGYADLAIGAPLEQINAFEAGAVNVLYGSNAGLTADGDQLWHQDRAGIDDQGEDNDHFGDALAAGDFNADGYADLAIGVPGENDDTGAVHVLYGSSEGLKADGSQVWDQDQPGIEGEADDEERFGNALTTGDFDGDGYDDLAIGVIFDEELGAVNVIYGSAGGLTADGNQRWHQDVEGVLGEAEFFERFGAALAAGDFNGDGRDDLAIGVSSEDLGDITSAGQVNVLYGSGSGLTAAGNQEWHQDTPGIDGVAEDFDWFGAALAVGDFNDDGYADLAIGVPQEDVGNIEDAGAINVIYGSAVGLHEDDDQFWHQNTPGVEGVAEAGDLFGSALAAGNFDGDGRDDLAIGVPGDDVGSIVDAGRINVLYGKRSGLHESRDQVWHQNIRGVEGIAEVGDWFGAALTAGDFDGDGKADLAIGVPLEDVGSIVDAGWINVLYGKRSRLHEDDDQVWHQDIAGVKDTAEHNDQFGAALR